MFRCDRGDYTRVLPTHCTRGCGCNGHPAFPTPSVFQGRIVYAQLGRIASRGREAAPDVIARSDLSAVAQPAKAEATKSNPELSCRRWMRRGACHPGSHLRDEAGMRFEPHWLQIRHESLEIPASAPAPSAVSAPGPRPGRTALMKPDRYCEIGAGCRFTRQEGQTTKREGS